MSNIREICKPMPHMHLLLIEFHLYSEKYVLQDLTMESRENMPNHDESALPNTYFTKALQGITFQGKNGPKLRQGLGPGPTKN